MAFISLIPLLSFAQKLPRVPEDWRKLQQDTEEFTIDTPLELKNDGKKDAKSSRKYFGSINGTYLYVFSDPVKSPNNLKIVTRFVNLSGKTLAEDIDLSKPTRLTFPDSFGYWQNIVMLRSKTRIYIAQTVSKNENDVVASRFISSFDLGTSLPDLIKETEVKPDAAIVQSDTTQKGDGSEVGQGSGLGIGSGSGNGSGSGAISGGIGVSPTNPVPHQTSPIKILSKARPGYTDFARFYEITGTVVTRVVFLATGEIGTVTAMADLPFGLKEQAIAAAKRIRFEPAYLDGVPVNVVKQVEYSFSLY